MILDFPSPVSTGTVFTAQNGIRYQYDGVKWTTVGSVASQGETGYTGSAGAAGADALWNWLGEYSAGPQYQPGDIVSYLGSTYRRNAVGNSVVGEVPTNLTYWQVVSENFNAGVAGDRLVNGSHEAILAGDGALLLPNGIEWLEDTGLQVGTALWQFDANGKLTLPGNASSNTSYTGVVGGDSFLNLDVQYGSLGDVYGGARVGTNSTNPLDIVTDFNGAHNTWRFNSDGNIVFPDHTVQSTAYTGASATNPLVWAVQATSTTKASYTQAVTYDSLGNSFALMWQGPWNNGGETRSSIVKLDAEGNTIWAIDLANGDSVNPWGFVCDASNNLYAIVQRRINNIYNNVVVKLYGTDGSIQWQVDIQDTHQANNMQAVPYTYQGADAVIIAGTAYNGVDEDFFIGMVSHDGTTSVPISTWGDQYNQEAYSVAVNNATGDIVLVGVKQDVTDAANYLEMVKFNINGLGAIWQKSITVADNLAVQGSDVCLLADGNWAILATHASNNDNQGIVTLKVDNTDGTVMWSREISAGCGGVSSSIATDATGNIYISASTFSGSSGEFPLFAKILGAYDTAGNIIWQKYFRAPGSNWLVDAGWWNGISSTGKQLAVYNDRLLTGCILAPLAPNGPVNSMGVVAQLTLLGENETIGPFETRNSYLTDSAIVLTVADTVFDFTTSTQTLAPGSTVYTNGSNLTYNLFHSGFESNRLASGGHSLTLTTDGMVVNELGRNTVGEYNGVTDSGNYFSNQPVGIRNASGYKRLVGLTNTAQTWLSLNDIGTQLGINPTWISGLVLDYQVTGSNFSGGNIGNMVGQIIIATSQNYNMNVTHSESAMTTNNSINDLVFTALNLWQVNGGTLEAIRTDSNSQQLDIIWTAKIFFNASENYC